jgi:hypothetical protein
MAHPWNDFWRNNVDDLDQATLNDDTASTQHQTTQSMDDTIAQTWADIQSRNSGSDDSEPAPVPASATRQRDEQGKFTARDTGDQAKQPAAPEQQPEQQQQQAAAPDAATPQSQQQSQAVPEWMQMGLRKDEAEAVARAPKEAQDAFARRMRESQEGLKRLHDQLGPRAQAGEAYEQAMAPFMPTIQRLGINPQQALHSLFSAEHGLRYGDDNQRASHALQVLNSYGINLQTMFAIASGQQAPAQQQVAVPQVQQQQQQQQQHPNDINQVVDEAVEVRFLQREIAQFQSQPGHEHFEELKPLMASLLTSGAAEGLEDAYDQALRAHPTHGAAWLAKQLADAEASRKAESQRKAKDARQAAAVNVPRRGTLQAAKPIGSMEDTIRDEAARLGLI